MADEKLRELERRAKDGCETSQRMLMVAKCRVGDCCGHALEKPPGDVTIYLNDLRFEHIPIGDPDVTTKLTLDVVLHKSINTHALMDWIRKRLGAEHERIDDKKMLGPSPFHPIPARMGVSNCPTCLGASWHDGPCEERAVACACHPTQEN